MAWVSPTPTVFQSQYPDFSSVPAVPLAAAVAHVETLMRTDLPTQAVHTHIFNLALAAHLFDLGYGNQAGVGSQTEYKSGEFASKSLKPNEVSNDRRSYREMYEAEIRKYAVRMYF